MISEHNRQVFIIRIWYEAREIEGALPQWRGVIEATQDDEQRYLKSLDEIISFILPYLNQMGVEVEMDWWFEQWLNHQQKLLPKQNVPDVEES